MNFGFLDLLIIFSVVAGPTKAVAMMAAGTAHMAKDERRAIAIKSVVTSSIILFVFALLGQQIIKFFHVSVPALEIAGGLILLIFAIGLILGDGHKEEGPANGDIAVYPLAMPLMASPQAIVALVVVMSRAPDWASKATALGALGAQMVINLVVMVGVAMAMKPGDPAAKKKGGIGEVVLRVVAILLAALAIELILLGLRDLGIIAKAAAAH